MSDNHINRYKRKAYCERSEESILSTKQRKREEYLGRKNNAKKNRREMTADNSNLSNIIVKWDYNNSCEFCGAIHLITDKFLERRRCCLYGEYLKPDSKYPSLGALPPELRHIAINKINHFNKSCVYYNTTLSIVSIGVDNGKRDLNGKRIGGFEKICGDSSVKLNGRTYNYFEKSSRKGNAINYFLFDAYQDVEEAVFNFNTVRCVSSCNNKFENAAINNVYMRRIFTELKLTNKYAAELLLIGNKIKNCGNDNNEIMKQLKSNINTKTHTFEIGAVLNDSFDGSIVYQYSLKNQKHILQSTHSNVEPLVFPLLFPLGESGWTNNIQKFIGCLLYICSRWLIPEFISEDEVSNNENIVLVTNENKIELINSIVSTLNNKQFANTEKRIFVKIVNEKYIICAINATFSNFLPSSRYQIMSRLAQYHMVDLYSRSQDYKLNWNRNNQHLIFGKYENDVDDKTIFHNSADSNNKEREIFSNSNPSFLAASFHGSPRHLKNLAISALTVVSEYGGPTLFITATVNPYWPEIQEMLLYGQSPYDRPDIVVRVFHKKVEMMIENLKKKKYFGNNSNIIYMMRVYEYQYRGFPHVHIVIKLSNTPTKNSDKDEIVNWIDQYLCAELPDSNLENTLYNIVSDNLLHTCSRDVNGCLDENGNCYRNYDKKVVLEKTFIDQNGYPQYRRRDKNDLKVVPYHKKLALDWNGHINVEFCASNFAILYLYKYLFKGVKKIRVDFNNTSDLHEKDEINQYLRGRIITSMDVMWRAFGFQTYPATFPCVRLICCKLQPHIEMFIKENKACDLLIYFRRPSCLKSLLFTEFFNIYDYSYSLPKTYSKTVIADESRIEDNEKENESIVSDNDDDDFIDDNVVSSIPNFFNITDKCSDIIGNSSRNSSIYIYKRVRTSKSLTRMQHVNMTMGEIYYLRCILLKVPVTSFDEILTVNGKVCASFQEAAIERNLIDESTEALNCFHESMIICTPAELRNLFVILTVNGHQTLCIFNCEEAKRSMYEDLVDQTYLNQDYAINKLLTILQLKFKELDKSLDLYGLPQPDKMDTELEREKMKYNIIIENDKFNLLNKESPNNNEQESFLKKIYDCIDNNKGGLFFLQGPAGSGKSTCVKKALSYCRLRGKIALGCASTALAAKVYEDFDTTHSLFKYPVIDNMEEIEDITDIQLKMDDYPERKELIENTSLIAWDEAPSNEVNIYKTVNKYFNNFPNTVLVLVGDWRQCPPVVKNGSMLDICKVSILNSQVWDRFNINTLSQNMRISIPINNRSTNTNCIHCRDSDNCQCAYHQEEYAKMILTIGNGKINGTSVLNHDPVSTDPIDSHNNRSFEMDNGSLFVKLPNLKYITETNEAIDFIFPDLFDNTNNSRLDSKLDSNCNSNNKIKSNSAILCATNKYVDEWNEIIQKLNKNESHILLSSDKFDCVDDNKDILKSMINQEILNKYNDIGVPPHKLVLKESDVCFVMRNLLKKDGLTNNTRVKILKIYRYSIRVSTIDTKVAKVFSLPRILFKVSLPYGRGFKMIRKQFPLRLAYSMTYNKSQGQELYKCLVDIRSPPFVHGHLYVALSRIKFYANIRIFCTDNNIDNESIILKNYFYSLLEI